MTPNIEWWKTTANHIWRSYFSLISRYGDNPDNLTGLSNAERNIYNACSSVRSKLHVSSDIDILQMFYTTPKGQEIYNVEDYSIRHNVPTTTIWHAVRHANRAVMEEIGLLDRK